MRVPVSVGFGLRVLSLAACFWLCGTDLKASQVEAEPVQAEEPSNPSDSEQPPDSVPELGPDLVPGLSSDPASDLASSPAATPSPSSASSLGFMPALAGQAEARYLPREDLILDGSPLEWIEERLPQVRLDTISQLIALTNGGPDGKGSSAAQFWEGPADGSLRLWLAWNEDDLILGGRVRDQYESYFSSSWWRGDSMELFLNAVDTSDTWGPDDYQVMLAPHRKDRPWGVYGRTGQRVLGASDGGFGGVQVAARETIDGYWFEARLPWRNFYVEPEEGAEFGFNFALCDRDDRNFLESYLTWTGQEQVAQFADRRASLRLVGPVPENAETVDPTVAATLRWRPLMPIFLALLYALALATRRVWSRRRARTWGVVGALAILLSAAALSALLNSAQSLRVEDRRSELQSYVDSFCELITSGKLGHPEGEELARISRNLFEGELSPEVERPDFLSLKAPQIVGLEGPAVPKHELERTLYRGIPFRRLSPDPRQASGQSAVPKQALDPEGGSDQDSEAAATADASSAAAASFDYGRNLPPRTSLLLRPEERASCDALHLVLRVSDERFQTAPQIPFPVLSAQPLLGEEPVGPPITVRHLVDLQMQDQLFATHRSLEPVLFEQDDNGRRLYGSGLLLELEGIAVLDGVRIENISPEPGYSVEVIAANLRSPSPLVSLPSLPVQDSGRLLWTDWRADIEAVVSALPESFGSPSASQSAPTSSRESTNPLGATSGAEAFGLLGLEEDASSGSLAVSRRVGPGREPVMSVRVRPMERVVPTRWGILPLIALVALAPFLVAILAEFLANRRRIRLKLAFGFAISSAVPLLGLTLLLDAALDQERRTEELERFDGLLERARGSLTQEVQELENRGQLLLTLAQQRLPESGLESEAEYRSAARKATLRAVSDEAAERDLFRAALISSFPRTSSELEQWWGPPAPNELRFLEGVDELGNRQWMGSGPQWEQVQRPAVLRSGLMRLWGGLYVCGVVESQSGAANPRTVMVCRPPSLGQAGESESLTLLGAGSDAMPTEADLEQRAGDGLRRGLFDTEGKLCSVLLAARRERGETVLADWSLTELLVASGLTAVFTVLLFAGILIGHLVRPIERLDRAVRRGLPEQVPVQVPDEVGNLTVAIQSFAGELAHRVDQLEALQVAHEGMSGRLDADRARTAVLDFFEQRTGAVAFLVWSGEVGEEPKLYDRQGAEHPLGESSSGPGFLELARSAEVLVQWTEPEGAAGEEFSGLCERERKLFGQATSLVGLSLIAGDECRGSVVLAWGPGQEPRDLEFLQTVAGQAAIVLENAELYRRAVHDPVTGFLSQPGFQARFAEEISRAHQDPNHNDGQGSGVIAIQVRLLHLPKDDELSAARLREAALRMRRATRGLVWYGRSGSADLLLAMPWSGEVPNSAELADLVVQGIGRNAWPDGESVGEILAAWCAWPNDGPSARFCLAVLEERTGLSEPVAKPTDAQRAQMASLSAGAPADRVVPADFVATSPLMLDTLHTLKRLALRDVTVLITGETGTGKDRAAALLHQLGQRAEGPLVPIHCPSLSDKLIEDELFGHAVGAFTGANQERISPFVAAAGGTLVLDEVAGLSPAGQVALLRILENREVMPLGATETVPIDVRLVATTSADLVTEVESGRFRRDLYFRLNVAPVQMPPLRLRRGDLPKLVERAVELQRTAGRELTSIAPEALDLLHQHHWPGNLRELENVLARGMLLAEGGQLTSEHLDLRLHETADEDSKQAELNPRQRALLERMAAGAFITSSELARLESISPRTALRDLQALARLGFLHQEGSKRGTRFRRRVAVS